MSTTMMIGSSLGDFILEAIIAEGGFGSVFRAAGGPRGGAAVKLLHAELVGSPEALARFAREVDVLDRVRHPGIVEILAVGRADDGRPWFAMELLAGRDLYAHIAERGRLTPGEALAILAPICEALAAAHDAGVIHRDVKASNVYLAGERVVLLDFGIAKLSDPVIGGGLTMSRQVIGSPSAMAPEQVAGRPASERSDVYGLGALLYHMLVGEPPFADSSPTVMQYLHCHARRPRPSARAALPAAVDDVVTTAMSIEAERRHAGPRELLAACRAAFGAAGAVTGLVRAALAVRVDVRVDSVEGDSELGYALDDAEAVWSAARAHFCTRGFVPALEAAESLVFVRPLAESDPDGVAEFQQLVTHRVGRHPAVSVAVLSRSGDVSFAGATPIAGSLLAIQDW